MGSIYKFNTLSLQASFVCQTILSLIVLYNLLIIKSEHSFKNFPIFWICCGFLTFSLVNLFALGAYNFINQNQLLVNVFQKIRIFSNYLLYSLFIVSFLVKQYSIKKLNGK